MFNTDSELCAFRLHRSPTYRRATDAAVRAYLRHDWVAARREFEAASQIHLASSNLFNSAQLTKESDESLNRSTSPAGDWHRLLDAASIRVLDAMGVDGLGR